MFCWCFEDTCLYNYEINKLQYHKIIDKLENSETLTITSLVKQNRNNDFLNFLIILDDKHYTKKDFGIKKHYMKNYATKIFLELFI